ncbi:MAG: hypothetical protein ACLQU2_18730, partial [Candidatus Binataceae bacterium]
TITAASGSMSLDAKRHGEIPFTVSNVSGRSLRGRAKVVPQDPKQVAWFKIAGESERDFAPNGTQQFTVKLDPLPDAKPGLYSFRLDAMSVELPDEDYTQGPSVGFSIAAPIPPPNGTFPLWIIPVLVVALLALVGVVLYFILRPSRTPKPPPTATATVTATISPTVTIAPSAVPTVQPTSDCIPGFVWREAFPGDHVCVTPQIWEQTAEDNRKRLDPERRAGFGPYGPDTCRQGFVWRDASPNIYSNSTDHVCVTPATRTQAAQDNNLDVSRKARKRHVIGPLPFKMKVQ